MSGVPVASLPAQLESEVVVPARAVPSVPEGEVPPRALAVRVGLLEEGSAWPADAPKLAG